MEPSEMLSNRGKVLKLFDGFKYRRGPNTQRGVAWRCTVKSCKARLYTDDSGSEILELLDCHGHEKSEKIVREQLANSVKRKAASDFSDKPLKIIKEELASTLSEFTEHMSKEDIVAAQRAIYRARKSALTQGHEEAK